MKKKRLGVRIFKGVLLTLLLLMVAGCVGGGDIPQEGHRQRPGCYPEDVKPTGYTSVVCFDDKELRPSGSLPPVPTVLYKTIDEIPGRICSMLLLPSRTSVFMSITELIQKVSYVPTLSVLLPEIFLRVLPP